MAHGHATGGPGLTDQHGRFVFDRMPPVSVAVLVYWGAIVVRTPLTRRCGTLRIGVDGKGDDAQQPSPQP